MYSLGARVPSSHGSSSHRLQEDRVRGSQCSDSWSSCGTSGKDSGRERVGGWVGGYGKGREEEEEEEEEKEEEEEEEEWRGSMQAAGESPESVSCIIGKDPFNLSSTDWLR
ncbi:hypothetical protein PAMA_002335 [Pampus argenteus]